MNRTKSNDRHSFLNGATGYFMLLIVLSIVVSWGVEVFARAFLRLG